MPPVTKPFFKPLRTHRVAAGGGKTTRNKAQRVRFFPQIGLQIGQRRRIR